MRNGSFTSIMDELRVRVNPLLPPFNVPHSGQSFLPILQVGSFLILFLAALLASCEPAQRGVKEGKRVPELVVVDLQGKVVKLANAEGKAVLLGFWLNGCHACVSEMGHLEKVYQKYQPQGLEVWGINIGGSTESVAAFAQKLQLSFPMLIDALQVTTEKYQVSAVPTVFLLDRQGLLKTRITGNFSLSTLENELRLLGFSALVR